MEKEKEFNFIAELKLILCEHLEIEDFEIESLVYLINGKFKKFIKRLKEELKICRDETDIWGDERWDGFERLFLKRIDKLTGDL